MDDLDEAVWFHYRPHRKWWARASRSGGFIFWPVRWQGRAIVAGVPFLWLAWMPIGLAWTSMPAWLPAVVTLPVTAAALLFGVMHAEEVERADRRPGDLRDS